MVYELENGFDRELLTITLLTAVSIFVVVALTFRSLIIPADTRTHRTVRRVCHGIGGRSVRRVDLLPRAAHRGVHTDGRDD